MAIIQMARRGTKTTALTRNSAVRRRYDPAAALTEVMNVFRVDIIGQAFEQPPTRRVRFLLQQSPEHDEGGFAPETINGLNGFGLSSYWATRLYDAVFEGKTFEALYLEEAIQGPSSDLSLWHAVEANKLPAEYNQLYPPTATNFFMAYRLNNLATYFRESPTYARMVRRVHNVLLTVFPERAFEVWPIYNDLVRLEEFLEALELEAITETLALAATGEHDN